MHENHENCGDLADGAIAHDGLLLRGWLTAYATWSALGFLNLALGGPGGPFTVAMLQAMVLGGFVACALHEGGHAVAARVLGGDVPEVRVGRGAPLARLQLGATTLTIGRYAFLGGATRMSWAKPAVRWRLALVMIAGPLANLAAAGLAFGAAELAAEGGLVQALLAGLGLAQLGAGVFNLLPAPATEAQPATDGAQAWAAIAGR